MPKKKKTGKVPVYLNVYDLTPINGYAYWLGLGVYHSGVQGKLLFRCCGFRSASSLQILSYPGFSSFLFSFKSKHHFLDLKISQSFFASIFRVWHVPKMEKTCVTLKKKKKRIVNMYCSDHLLFAGNFYYNSFISKADIMLDLCNKVLDLVSHTHASSFCVFYM